MEIHMTKKKFFLFTLLIFFFSSLVLSQWVKLKTPKGGEQWELGSKQLIEWEKDGNFTKFRIILRKGKTRIGDIAWVMNPNKTSYKWKKVGKYIGGSVLAGNDYKIRIKGYLADDSMRGDESIEYFSIAPQSERRLVPRTRVKLVKKIIDISISPAGGKYVTGQEINISWTTNWKIDMNDKFLLALYCERGKKYKRYLGQSTVGLASKEWIIPSDIRPEFYTIKIEHRKSFTSSPAESQPQDISGFSDMFHIAKSYQSEDKTIEIKADTIVNTYGYSVFGDEGHLCKNYVPDKDPGPGKMRIGTNYRKPKLDGSVECYYNYRSFVWFDLSAIPKGSQVISAELKYHRYSGHNCDEKVYVLNQRWNRNEALSKAKATLHANLKDFRDVAATWLGFPTENYGIFLALLEDKKGGWCISFFENVRLVLTIREPK
jgi:hypothetical protein